MNDGTLEGLRSPSQWMSPMSVLKSDASETRSEVDYKHVP